MNVIQDYFRKTDALYDYFGLADSPVVYPFEDRRAYNWQLDVGNVHFGYGDISDIFNEEAYHSPLVKDGRIGQSIFRGEEYTAVLTLYSLGDCVVWAVFDNQKCVEA